MNIMKFFISTAFVKNAACVGLAAISLSSFTLAESIKSEDKDVGIQAINPPSLYDGSAFSLSQGTVDITQGVVYVSGQVDWGLDYSVKNKNIEAQTASAMANVETVLKAADSSIENILQLRVYVRGELADNMEKVVPVIVNHLNGARPALTGVGVASLATPDTLIEIEAVAKVIK